MATGILGLGGGGSAALNQELLDKLKDADRTVKVEPIEEKLEEWDSELEAITMIEAKALEFLGTLSKLDLYSEEENAFEQFSASTSGTAGVFDAVDIGDLSEGTNYVNVTQLAQRDVYQTVAWEGDETTVMPYGALEINGTVYSTSGKRYEDFVDDLNASDDVVATVVKVSDTQSRLVIKSKEPGIDNELTIKQSIDYDFGFMYNQSSSNTVADVDVETVVGAGQSATLTIDGKEVAINDTMTYQDLANAINALDGITSSIVDGGNLYIEMDDGSALSIEQSGIDLGFSSNQTLYAQNLNATVDGVSYDISSNTIDVQGSLTFTATETGNATISIQKDTTNVIPAIEEFIQQYNSFLDTVNNELNNAESPISDKSSLRTILSQVKEMLFANYGSDDSLNIFNFGFELDKMGHLSIDNDTFNKAVSDNLDDLKSLFVGTAENPGMGTQLKEYIDGLDAYNGLLWHYDQTMDDRKKTLEEDLEKAIEDLDNKYSQLASQFAAYGSIISQMESSFGGLKMMIEMETASK